MIKSILTKLILGFGLTLSLGAVTYAGWHNPSSPSHRDPDPGHGHPREAPEVDPSLAISGFSLLAGTLTVLRARRSK